MQQIITKQVSVHPLDGGLGECSKWNATYQLEIYHSDQSPKKNIAAVSEYNGQFSYPVGTTVNVEPRIDIKFGLWLTNAIMNNCLQNYINEH